MTTGGIGLSRTAAIAIVALFVSSVVAVVALGGLAPAGGNVQIVGTRWALVWGFEPQNEPGPLWLPGGTCVGYTGNVSAGADFSCYVGWSGEQCTPLNGTSAACSSLVGLLVDPPFHLVGTGYRGGLEFSGYWATIQA